LLEFSRIGQRFGIDLLSARPRMEHAGEELAKLMTVADRKLIADIHHELDHATVHLSTSFGAVLNALDQVFVDRFAHGLAAEATDLDRWFSDPHRCPMALSARERGSCDATTYDLFALRSLVAALLGRPGMRDDRKIMLGVQLLRGFLCRSSLDNPQ